MLCAVFDLSIFLAEIYAYSVLDNFSCLFCRIFTLEKWHSFLTDNIVNYIISLSYVLCGFTDNLVVFLTFFVGELVICDKIVTVRSNPELIASDWT